MELIVATRYLGSLAVRLWLVQFIWQLITAYDTFVFDKLIYLLDLGFLLTFDLKILDLDEQLSQWCKLAVISYVCLMSWKLFAQQSVLYIMSLGICKNLNHTFLQTFMLFLNHQWLPIEYFLELSKLGLHCSDLTSDLFDSIVCFQRVSSAGFSFLF